MSRYYIVQYRDVKKGYVDIPQTASLSEKTCNDAAANIAVEYSCVARVIRKPKGWQPNVDVILPNRYYPY